MYNIKFMGKYKDESQILTGELRKGAVQYNEPNTLTRVFFFTNYYCFNSIYFY